MAGAGRLAFDYITKRNKKMNTPKKVFIRVPRSQQPPLWEYISVDAIISIEEVPNSSVIYTKDTLGILSPLSATEVLELINASQPDSAQQDRNNDNRGCTCQTLTSVPSDLFGPHRGTPFVFGAGLKDDELILFLRTTIDNLETRSYLTDKPRQLREKAERIEAELCQSDAELSLRVYQPIQASIHPVECIDTEEMTSVALRSPDRSEGKIF